MGSHIISTASATAPSDLGLGPSLVAIRRLVRTLRTSAAAVERATGLSSAQLFVLHTLARRPYNSINELADQTLTDQSSVSVVVRRLAERGLVTRTPAPDDARRSVVAITPAGRHLTRGAPVTVQGRLEAALRHFAPHERDRLTQLLDDLATYLDAASDPAPFIFEDDATGAH